jgi:hypothetical protein
MTTPYRLTRRRNVLYKRLEEVNLAISSILEQQSRFGQLNITEYMVENPEEYAENINRLLHTLYTEHSEIVTELFMIENTLLSLTDE